MSVISENKLIESVEIIKINNNYYDYKYLRKYIPYLIKYNSNNFYICNRDYEYNGLDIMETPNIINSKITYLFKDGSTCWTSDNKRNNNNLKKIILEYNELTKNKNCLNPNDETKKLMSLF